MKTIVHYKALRQFTQIILLLFVTLCGCSQADREAAKNNTTQGNTTVIDSSATVTPTMATTSALSPAEASTPTISPTLSPSPTMIPTAKRQTSMESTSSDGTTTETYYYNSQGVMIRSVAVSTKKYGDNYTEYIYDSSGKLIHTESEGKSQTTVSDYQYDGLKALVTTTYTNKSDGSKTTRTGTQIIDEHGNIIFLSDSTFDRTYTYDENNNRIESIEFNRNDSSETRSVAEFDEHGYWKKTTGYYKGKQTYEYTVFYSTEGKKTIEDVMLDGKPDHRFVYELDDDGDVLWMERFNAYGKLEERIEYKYEYIPLVDNQDDKNAILELTPTTIPTGDTPDPTSVVDRNIPSPDTPTPAPTATPTPSPKPTATPTPKATATPTQKPTSTPTQKPTATPTPPQKQLTGRLDSYAGDYHVYYVVNTNTGKFHKPGCRHISKMNAENTAYATDHGFANSSDARSWLTSNGYDSCGTCKP